MSEMVIDPDLQRMMRDVLAQRPLAERLGQPVDGVVLDIALWRQLDELGLTRLTVPEELGGSGAGWAEAAALHREAAAAAVQLPLPETDVLAGWLLGKAGLHVDGSIRTVAVVRPDGTAAGVPWAVEADRVTLVTVEHDRALVDDVDPGDLSCTRRPTASGRPRYDVRLSRALDGGTPVDTKAAHHLLLRGALVRSVQSVGAMERILSLCMEHTTVRTQFGRPIAKFQSVQNLVADIAAEVALAKAAVDAAVADAVATDLEGDCSAFQVAVARSCVGRATTTVVRNAHQVHGAIGTTIEHPLQLFTLPLLDWRSEFGGLGFWNRALGRATRRDPAALWDLASGGAAAAAVGAEVAGGAR